MAKVATDSEFRAKLEAEHNDEARKKIVKDAGFDFTPEDLKALRSEKLSAQDLDAVAGGKSGTWVAAAAGTAGAVIAAV